MANHETASNQPAATPVYKRLGNVELRLHIFHAHAAGAGPKPCIVLFFGGGFVGGDPGQFYPHCQYFSGRGMEAMAAEYRIKSKHGVAPYECVADAKSAIRWVRRNAEELGIDPDRIVAGGGSAGGHLAAATGTLPGFDEPAEDPAVSARPNALVLFNPVYDNGPEAYGHERVKDRWREFSPLHNISAETPPTIVFMGTEDRLTPVETCKRFRDRMREEGVRSDLWVYEGHGHGFFNFADGRNPAYYATVYAADRFLASLGFLQGLPSISNRCDAAGGINLSAPLAWHEIESARGRTSPQKS